MVTYYSTADGDRIDLIVLDHYGSHDMLGTVLAYNTHLCSMPMDLTEGIEIVLPPVEKMIPYENSKQEEKAYKGWLEI